MPISKRIMDPPNKQIKSQASKSSVPESKTHTTRKRKRKRSSLDYASPTDEKDYRPANSQTCPAKKLKKAVIVPRQNENRCDPFNVLDDDAVFLIIEQLSARETEILRRVSKLWKASSEAHCGRNALKKHFPLAAAKTEGCGSRVEENLRFRRQLYYHESLAIGNATRAIRCTGALDWHLEHDTLVWSNKKGDLSIRTLRSRSHSLPITSPATSIRFRSFKIPFVSITRVQLTEHGDMIVDLQGGKMRDDLPRRLNRLWRGGQRIMRISRQGAILWERNVDSLVSTTAVGKNALFFLERHQKLPTSEYAFREVVVAFVKVSLEDGSTSYCTQLPDRFLMVEPDKRDKHLRLFSNEAFAVWRDISNYAYVFSTKTGKVHHVYPRNTRTPPIVGRQSSFIWDINSHLLNPPLDVYSAWPIPHSFSQLVTFHEASPEVKFEAIAFPNHIRYRYPHSEWRFSGDHGAFFYFTHIAQANVDFDRRFLGQNEPTDPHTNVWVSIMDTYPSEQPDIFWMEEKASATQISLPSRSETLGERRPLELDIPWRMRENDYLSMVNDYMVYHSSDQEIFLLVDFWPNW